MDTERLQGLLAEIGPLPLVAVHRDEDDDSGWEVRDADGFMAFCGLLSATEAEFLAVTVNALPSLLPELARLRELERTTLACEDWPGCDHPSPPPKDPEDMDAGPCDAAGGYGYTDQRVERVIAAAQAEARREALEEAAKVACPHTAEWLPGRAPPCCKVRDAIRALGEGAHAMKSHPTLADVAEALLLFHAGGPWDEDRAARWFNLTNCVEATTRNLCELARRALLAMPEDLAATVRRDSFESAKLTTGEFNEP